MILAIYDLWGVAQCESCKAKLIGQTTLRSCRKEQWESGDVHLVKHTGGAVHADLYEVTQQQLDLIARGLGPSYTMHKLNEGVGTHVFV